MRLKIYLVAATVSIGMWVGSYQVAAAGYRMVEAAGLMPDLNIHATLTSLFG